MSSKFKKGDILFSQGDPSDRVMLVRTGEIEVLREIGPITVMLGRVREGEWLGEMGVVERRNRSATARAAVDGEVEVMTAQKFLEWVSSDPPLARDLILRLSVRLREVEDKIVEGLVPFAHNRLDEGRDKITEDATILLTAQTEELASRMGAAPIPIAKLPFLVGRIPVTGEAKASRHPDLLIADGVPFRLSRQHFLIARNGDQLLVSDLGSALGTVVNGRAIGSHFMKDDAPLHRGENHIVAGGGD